MSKLYQEPIVILVGYIFSYLYKSYVIFGIIVRPSMCFIFLKKDVNS